MRAALKRAGRFIPGGAPLYRAAKRFIIDTPPLKRLAMRILKSRRTISYETWIAREAAAASLRTVEINQHVEEMLLRPKFSIVVTEGPGIAKTMQSIRDQVYGDHEVRVFPAQEIYAADITKRNFFADIEGEYVVFMAAGDVLSPHALYAFAAEINARPEADIVYADEDTIDDTGRRSRPFFKPDWSPDYLETFNYIGFAACFRCGLIDAAVAFECFYDVVLRATEKAKSIRHLRRVLYHRPPAHRVSSRRDGGERDRRALQGRLHRTMRSGTVLAGGNGGPCALDVEVPRGKLVSIVIPTAGRTRPINGKPLDLIVNCVSQIRNETCFDATEIIVVDNGDLSDDQLRFLRDAGCRMRTYTDSHFNVAKKINMGAEIAKGDILLLLNDDIGVISSDWLRRMLQHFEKPHVGVVGAKLLYADGTIQHAGVVHNRGNPEHVRRHFPRDDLGYHFSTCGARNFSAVTGACMMTRTDAFRQVGGFTEEFSISFNDVDYCMKVRSLGLYVVYAPVELFHYESQSRHAVLDMQELYLYRQRWARQTVVDPFYNENFLSMGPPTFEPEVSLPGIQF